MELEIFREKYAVIEKVEQDCFKIMNKRDKSLFLLQQRSYLSDSDIHSSVIEPLLLFISKELPLFSDRLAYLHEVLLLPEENKLLFIFEYQPLLLSEVLFIEFLSQNQKTFLMYELASLLFNLHNDNLILIGLSPQRLLVSKFCNLKLMGLQMAVKTIDGSISLKNKPDRLIHNFDNIPDQSVKYYLAPEVLLGGCSISFKADVWSFCVLLCELFTQKPLFHGTSFMNQLELLINFLGTPSKEEIKAMNIPTASCHYLNLITNSFFVRFDPLKPLIISQISDDNLQKLIARGLSFNPNERPSIEEIISSSFFKEFTEKEKVKKNLCLNDLIYNLFLNSLAVPSKKEHSESPKNQTIKFWKKMRNPLCFLILNEMSQKDFWKSCYDDGNFKIIVSKFIDHLKLMLNKKFNFQEKNKTKFKINIFGLEISKDPKSGKGMQIKLEDK